MPARHDSDIAMLERGEVYYLRLPVAGGGPALHVALRPQAKHRARLAVLEMRPGGEIAGTVVAVASDGAALSARIAEMAAAAGVAMPEAEAAGIYRILRHGEHGHLLQVLDAPEPGAAPVLPAEMAWRLTVEAPPVPRQPIAIGTERPGVPVGAVVGPGAASNAGDTPDRLDQESATLRLLPAGEDAAGGRGGPRLGLDDLFTDLRFERDHRPRRALDEDTPAELPLTSTRRSPYRPSGL